MSSVCARALLSLVCAAMAGAVVAEPLPRVVEIHFEGNDITREEVLLREMNVAVGDFADPQLLVDSHQAIIDLGLFREVDLQYLVREEGTVVRVRVREKRFLLPIPRVDGDADGGRSYGAQLRWDNVLGRNHSLSTFVEQGKPGDRVAESERRFRIGYDAPYVWNDRDGLYVMTEYLDRDAVGPNGIFTERQNRFEFLFMRDYRDSRPRTGWLLGAGVHWQDQRTGGPLAPPPDGMSTALVLTADYRDLRFHLYSETGQRFATRLELAQDGLLSDLSYRRLDWAYEWHIGLPVKSHRNLNLIHRGGIATGGTPWRNTYSLGGSNSMRGYELDFIEGQRYATVAVEYLQPMWHDWLRLLLLVEAGATAGSMTAAPDGGVYANLGVGVRIRLPWFVNVELEFGAAYPLHGQGRWKAFAGRN